MAMEMAIATPMAMEETAAEEPDDQSSVKSDELSSNRIKFLCSYGGKILPRPGDGKLRYVGGETRVVAASRSITFADLIAKLEKVFGSSLSLKYQLPTEDLDALVSVTSDDDLENMLEEYERLEAREGSAKVRAFLFPAKIKTATAADTVVLGNVVSGNKASLEQRFLDAVNGSPTRLKPSSPFSHPDPGCRLAVPFEPRCQIPAHGDDQLLPDMTGTLREVDLNKRVTQPSRKEPGGGDNFPDRARAEVSSSIPARYGQQKHHAASPTHGHRAEYTHPSCGGFQRHARGHVAVQRVDGDPQFQPNCVQSTTPCCPVIQKLPSQHIHSVAGNTHATPHCQGGFPATKVGRSPCTPIGQYKSPLRYAIRTATQIHHDRVLKPAQQNVASVFNDPRMDPRFVCCVDHASSAYVVCAGPPSVQVRYPGWPMKVPSHSGWP